MCPAHIVLFLTLEFTPGAYRQILQCLYGRWFESIHLRYLVPDYFSYHCLLRSCVTLPVAGVKTGEETALENNIVARTVRRREALEDRLSPESMALLGEYELAAVRLAFANGKVTAAELAGHIGRGQRTATRVLKGLSKDGGLLEWHGSSATDPNQFYALA